MSHNNISIIGNLTEDPKIVAFESGSAVAKLRIASSRSRRVKDEKGKEVWEDYDSLFIDVECWGQLAVNCGASLKKGFPVIVEGSLVNEFWEEGEGDNAVPRSKVMLKARNVAFDMNRYQLNSARTTNSGNSLDGHEAVPVMDLDAVMKRLGVEVQRAPSFDDADEPIASAEDLAPAGAPF